MREFIKKELVVRDKVSTEYGVSKFLYENQDRTVFFENVEGYDFKIVGNVCPSRERLYAALETDREGYIKSVLGAIKNPVEPVLTNIGKCYEVEEKCLLDLPMLRHFERDGGRYITTSAVVANDPDYGRNVSIHRMMVLDEKRLAIRVVERHLYMYYKRAEERDESLDVAICIGLHPAVFFACAYPVPLGYDEFKLASSLMGSPIELVRCRNVNLEVPSDSEIVIEGKMLANERVDEGPFADITGTYDIVRKQPVIEVSRIIHRKNPIYHALLPSSKEHRIFMGMPQEPKIFSAVKKVANVKNVCLTDGGCNWLHGVVSIAKKTEGDGRKAIDAALEAHRSMKHVVIVDDDIDIFDNKRVEYAIATRFQAHERTTIRKGVKGSSLDPSASEGAITTKVGIDATKVLDKGNAFEVATMPK